jgi:hypothetical protein
MIYFQRIIILVFCDHRTYFGNTNYFGGPDEISCKSSIALSQAQSSIDTMIVFISDVWLDSPMVMEKLQTLFIGYSECPPYGFVFCGNFLSELKYGLRCQELTGKQIFFHFKNSKIENI